MSEVAALTSTRKRRARWLWENVAAARLHDDAQAKRDWDRLNAARGDFPFLSADAVAAALSAFGSGNERLLIARDEHAVIAMMVMTPSAGLRWSTFQPSQLPLGVWVAARDASIAEVASALLRPLASALAISVTQVDPLFAPREADSPAVQHGDYIETAWIDVEGSFEAYWSARGKNLRQNMRKQRNRLAADGVQTRMLTWRDPKDIAAALERYAELESVGWKALEGTAIHPHNAQGRFYLRLFECAARNGEAVIYEYLFDRKTVAMDLCLLRQRVLVMLKTAYDESIKSHSPAFLLHEEELQAIFAGGEVARIEFYGRVMDWHGKLTDRKRTLHHLTVYRWAWLNKARLAWKRLRPT